MSEQKPDARFKIGGKEFEFFGKPGAAVRMVGLPCTPESHRSRVESVIDVTLESVILALYKQGALDEKSLSAMGAAVEAIGSRMAYMETVGLTRADDSPFGIVAGEVYADDELEFDAHLVVSDSDDGAFVGAWKWIGNSEVVSYFQKKIEARGEAAIAEVDAMAEAVESLVSTEEGESSIEILVAYYGANGAFEKIRHLVTEQSTEVPRQRQIE